jgi:hypothetical protein
MRPSVRRMSAEDSGWAAALMERRREVYASYSPVFWRPARGVTAAHAAFLGGKVSKGRVVGRRTDRGFIIGEVRGSEGFVDDFGVEADVDWVEDGVALLCSVWPILAEQGANMVRVVSAAADHPKVEMLRSCSLELVEQWWVKPVDPVGAPTATGRTDGCGFSGTVSSAPPVYDPGGPVLFVDQLADGTPTGALEQQAAERGVLLVIVPVPAGGSRERELRAAAFTVASAWYLGKPAPPADHGLAS